jgi:MYXO-CTERM domain-containing protein
MTKLNTTFVRAAAVLALALGCSAGQALAAPIYHVAIDTTSLSGQTGYLDFLYLALDNADPAQATLTHFAGDFDVDTASFTFGGASGAAGSAVTLASGNGGSEFGQLARLAGRFSFDLSFGAPSGTGTGAGVFAGTMFSVALLDDALHYLGGTGDLVTISLQPGQPDAISADASLASVNAVPEPSSAWLGAAGLLLLAASRRPKYKS